MNANLHESEELEQRAWEDQFAAVSHSDRERFGLAAERVGGALVLAAPGLRHVMVNRVIDFGADAALRADGVAERYRARGVDQFLVNVAPGHESSAAEPLTRVGLLPFRRSWVKLVRLVGPVSSVWNETQIRGVDPSTRVAFAEILCQSFDMPAGAEALWAATVGRPRWHCFLSLDGGRPIGCGVLFVHEDIAYLAGGATLPEYRGRGVQSAMIAHRLRLAFALGCRAVYSETGVAVAGEPNHSERNMLRAGFTPLYVRKNYWRAGAAAPRVA